MIHNNDLTTRYRHTFANAIPTFAVRSPGRINLIGEHTDYNDGFVLPIAMTQALLVLAGPADDEHIEVHSSAFGETVRFPAREPGFPGQPNWANYVRGVATLLVKQGCQLRSGRLWVDSEVPLGGGVSSSAALEIGVALALLALAGEHMEPISLALLAQQAEHEYANSPCGIMDQFICVLGQANHALLLDCRSQTFEQIPLLLDDATMIVMNTQVKHAIGSSQYPIRQQQCREALARLQSFYPQVTALRDVSFTMLDAHRHDMNPTTFKRARHVVTEIERTLQAAQALRQNELETFGQLMYDSHQSLKNDYGVSCPELDHLVEIAKGIEGVYGARMTGGGFGGCAIALIRREAENALRSAIAQQYDTRFDKPAIVYTTGASDGATVQAL